VGFRKTKEKPKLRDNLLYRAMWGNFKSDKWKKKTRLISELTDVVKDLIHPAVTKDEIIEIREFIIHMIYSDALERPFKPFLGNMMRDFWGMDRQKFLEKWGDKL